MRRPFMNWPRERHGVRGEPDFARNRIERAGFKLSKNLPYSNDGDSAVAGGDRLLSYSRRRRGSPVAA